MTGGGIIGGHLGKAAVGRSSVEVASAIVVALDEWTIPLRSRHLRYRTLPNHLPRRHLLIHRRSHHRGPILRRLTLHLKLVMSLTRGGRANTFQSWHSEWLIVLHCVEDFALGVLSHNQADRGEKDTVD